MSSLFHSKFLNSLPQQSFTSSDNVYLTHFIDLPATHMLTQSNQTESLSCTEDQTWQSTIRSNSSKMKSLTMTIYLEHTLTLNIFYPLIKPVSQTLSTHNTCFKTYSNNFRAISLPCQCSDCVEILYLLGFAFVPCTFPWAPVEHSQPNRHNAHSEQHIFSFILNENKFTVEIIKI